MHSSSLISVVFNLTVRWRAIDRCRLQNHIWQSRVWLAFFNSKTFEILALLINFKPITVNYISFSTHMMKKVTRFNISISFYIWLFLKMIGKNYKLKVNSTKIVYNFFKKHPCNCICLFGCKSVGFQQIQFSGKKLCQNAESGRSGGIILCHFCRRLFRLCRKFAKWFTKTLIPT